MPQRRKSKADRSARLEIAAPRRLVLTGRDADGVRLLADVDVSAIGVDVARDDAEGIAVAVVHGADGVRHLVAAHSAEERLHALAEYVKRRAGSQLFPRSARRVLDLIERGRSDRAVRLYFALVGRRWDDERLTLASVELR